MQFFQSLQHIFRNRHIFVVLCRLLCVKRFIDNISTGKDMAYCLNFRDLHLKLEILLQKQNRNGIYEHFKENMTFLIVL
jgi:hypothetical protein